MAVLEGCAVSWMVGTAVRVGVLFGMGVPVAVGGTAELVLVGVGVAVLVSVGAIAPSVGNGVLVGMPVSGKGIMGTGVCETAVPVSRNSTKSDSEAAATVGSKGANSKS